LRVIATQMQCESHTEGRKHTILARLRLSGQETEALLGLEELDGA